MAGEEGRIDGPREEDGEETGFVSRLPFLILIRKRRGPQEPDLVLMSFYLALLLSRS